MREVDVDIGIVGAEQDVVGADGRVRLHQERRIEITYAELLPYALSQVEYRFFLKA